MIVKIPIKSFGYKNTATKNIISQHSIAGIVQKCGINLPCRVRLYEKKTGLKRDEIVTDNNGNYKFTDLQPIEFFLVAHDPKQQYNAIIQDNVIPK